MLPPAALVFSDRCGGAFIRSVRRPWSEIPTYQALPKGGVLPLVGPPAEHLSQIAARTVVWVGIPLDWVEAGLDGAPAPWESSFVGRVSRFTEIKNVATVKEALEAAYARAREVDQEAERELAEAEQAQAEAAQERVETRRRWIGEEAPWFVPEGLA